jgi:drug/metabolite transporter (DMT)-like permease
MTAPAQPVPSTSAPASRIDLVLFALLGFMWGSSYLFIKIGVDDGLTPFTLIMLRLLIGFSLLAVVVAVARESLPPFGRIYGHLFVMGAINIAIPFSLITWAEQTVDSSVAAILNAAVPLFVMIIAAIFLRDERLTSGRVAGLIVGFVGVAVLVGFDPADLASGDMAGEIALIGSTIAYAIGAVYSRRNIHGLRPMIPALFQVFFGLVIVTRSRSRARSRRRSRPSRCSR